MTDNNHKALAPESLYHACDLSTFKFETTDDLHDSETIIGQDRALGALNFGIGIKHDGYNLFVSGSTGLGKHSIVKKLLNEKAEKLDRPSDWCYINNFEHPHKPSVLKVPAGYGCRLRDDMNQLVEDLLIAIPSAFETDEYNARVKEIQDELDTLKEKEFLRISEKANRENVALMRTPGGYTLGPMKDGKILTPNEFDALPENEQTEIKNKIDEIEKDVSSIIRKLPIWARESRNKVKALIREVSQLTVDQFIDELLVRYIQLDNVTQYIQQVKDAIIRDVDSFRFQESDNVSIIGMKKSKDTFTRFHVNVLVDNSELTGAPVIFEDNPTYNNLVGRVEHMAQLGTLITDFTLIKSGALHQANGGFLVFDARRVLTSPFAWEGLKRTLRAHEIRIESLEKMLSIASTISLEPEPIPVDIKIVLTGDRWLFYLLKKYDPEFSQLFKVAADFSEDIDRNDETAIQFTYMIAELQKEKQFKPFDRGAVAQIIEDSSRKVEDAEKLSLHKGHLIDLLRESDYWSSESGRSVTTREDVYKAIDTRIHRLDQIRERVHEQVLRGTYLLETEGSKIAQVNGLSIIQLGDYSFGRPSRITATARLGTGKVIDIEREADLGGSIHSKGVLILSSYLANHYAHDRPLSLSASLVFEQSYGIVEGDSASVAELCALLSALARIPIKQNFAVTGSVNQLGQVQAIGGINEKIEGFFDICNARGLTGDQAVIMPSSNIQHLMLRRDIVKAVDEKRFNVFAVDHIDQVMELLTGEVAGELDDKGSFPDNTINGKVQNKLIEMNKTRQSFSKHSSNNNDNEKDEKNDAD